MSRYKAEQTDSDFLTDVFKIALGVFIGGLLAALVYSKYMEWELTRALGQVNTALSKDAQRMQAEMHQRIRQSDRAVQQAAAAAQMEKDRIAEQGQQRQIAQREETERDVRRQAAWERYFQPSPACRADSISLDCANAFMAAKKRFLEQYRD